MGTNSTLRYTPEYVRETCLNYMSNQAKHVKIDDSKITAFVDQLDHSKFKELAEATRFPLSFQSIEDEVNFLSLVDILNFGSGYRKPLHKYCERGAHETMMFGVIGMYISEPRLDAKFLRGITIDAVSNYFSTPLDRDEELSTGIYISKPGPLKPLAEGIQQVLNETGSICLEKGFNSLGAFVLAQLEQADASVPSAAVLVNALASTFPGFRDVHNDVQILKKAQLLASNLYRRFETSSDLFKFSDIQTLTAFSDNVVPCVLHALGILEYTPGLAAAINEGKLLPFGSEEEIELRAGAIVACEQILTALRVNIPEYTMMELGSYLWRVGKDPIYRPLERHATQDTVLY